MSKLNITDEDLHEIVAELMADFIIGFREKIELKNLENKIRDNDI